jgi:hypothetical protein
LITEGKYSVWFRTSAGEGTGVVELGRNGELSGGDETFAYTGHWEQDGDRFKATISSTRIAPGFSGVFGKDQVDISVIGSSRGGVTASCTGFAKQAPDLGLEVTLVRMSD